MPRLLLDLADWAQTLCYSDARNQNDSVVPLYFALLIFTLGLVLIVELSLHVLDHRAHRHFFIREVLKTVYKECKTPGM